MRTSRRSGFTLIEMLLVIAIIGILTTTLLVGFGNVRGRGRDARRSSDLRQVQTALELYFNKCGYYPGAAASPNCAGFAAINTWSALTTSLTGSGIGTSQVPNDPSAGQNYFYGTNGTGSSYVLGARFEDPGNPALSQDIDGTVNSVDCADPVYCIQF